MLRGVLADVNIEGHVDFVMAVARAARWGDLWQELGLDYAKFSDVALDRTASDAEIWACCQQGGWLLMTDNRNEESETSLEATLQSRNTSECLPVLTIANIHQLRHSRDYAEQVVESLFGILIDIEALRGAGRLYLP